jgi:hypothetical protein
MLHEDGAGGEFARAEDPLQPWRFALYRTGPIECGREPEFNKGDKVLGPQILERSFSTRWEWPSVPHSAKWLAGPRLHFFKRVGDPSGQRRGMDFDLGSSFILRCARSMKAGGLPLIHVRSIDLTAASVDAALGPQTTLDVHHGE